MPILRAAGIALLLAVIGAIGVALALATACVAEGGLPRGAIVGFAFLYCSVPAALLAWLTYGGIHLVERLWPRLTRARTVDVIAGRGRRRRGVPGASGPAAFHAPVHLPASSPPSPTLLGPVVAVPLAFLNVPGWLAVSYSVVEGVAASAAIFVVPGLVCGVLIGTVAKKLRA